MKHAGSRRISLDNEKKKEIPNVSERNRPLLGQYLKFVNRENSINQLMKHAADQYRFYNQLGGLKEHQAQFAACSGGP
eukprot:scaffold490083_cov130-Attheya_sp.AAC.1